MTTTTTRTMSDLNITKSEIEMVKAAYKRNNIPSDKAVDFLFFVDSLRVEIFGGDKQEQNTRLDGKARRFIKNGYKAS